MTTYTLPITCKELRYMIYFIFPFILLLGMFTADWEYVVPPLNLVAVILGGIGTIMITIFKLIDMDEKGEIPSFRCKCDE